MKQYSKIIVLFISLFIISTQVSANDQGGQFKKLGNLEAHYSAFPSTFLQPNIAKHYGIERSSYAGVINISVLDAKNKNALKVNIKGVARNLLGNLINLEFKEIVEGDSVYYIAAINYRNEETYRFEIDIQQNNQTQTLKFQQKFYVD